MKGDAGLRYENRVACALLKHAEWQQDVQGKAVGLHDIRTKDDAEVDFCLSEGDSLSDLIACKLTDAKPHRARGVAERVGRVSARFYAANPLPCAFSRRCPHDFSA